MSNHYDRLWVFGDSHSTPNVCVNPSNSFWGLAAVELGIPQVINCSRPKLSFDSVSHILIGEQDQYNFDKDFFLIGLPPLERITIFDDYKNTEMIAKIFDTKTWENQPIDIASHRGLINLQYKELDKISVLISDRSWIETQILKQIFLITNWLDQQQAKYLIVNLSKNLDPDNVWGPSRILLDYCVKHSRCKLFKNSLYDVNVGLNKPADFDQFGWFGHHGPVGNQVFFEKTIKECLC